MNGVATMLFIFGLSAARLAAATCFVDRQAEAAGDTNPGTVARAGSAPELKPGDQVLIKSGVYRETVETVVSGEPRWPIVFAAAPGARVVIEGPAIVKGRWRRLGDDGSVKELFPHALRRFWKTRLGEKSFADFNVHAGGSWEPSMRYDWDDESPLARRQTAVSQDPHCRAMPIRPPCAGTRLEILAGDELDVARVWRPRDAKRFGADMRRWP